MGLEVTANVNSSKTGEIDVLSITIIPFPNVYLILEIFLTSFMLCTPVSMLKVQMESYIFTSSLFLV